MGGFCEARKGAKLTTTIAAAPAQLQPQHDRVGEPGPDWEPLGLLDRLFHYSFRGSSIAREVRGGLATFFTMAYIVVLNPIILSGGKDQFGHSLNFVQLTSSTALVAAVMCLVMGLAANLPLAMASGMGLNGVFAYTVAAKMSWPDTWGLAILSGALIVLLVLTGVRQALAMAVPDSLKRGIAAGIGLFIGLIGLVDAGFVRRSSAGPVPVSLGSDGSLHGWPTVVFVVGLVLTIALWARKVRGALLIGIVSTTVFAVFLNHFAKVGPMVGADGKFNPVGWNLNVPNVPHKIVSSPDFGLLGHVSLFGGIRHAGVATFIILLFAVFLSDFFDALGTITGVSEQAGLVENGRIPRFGRALGVDGAGAIAGGFAGASTATAYIESSTGVSDGARTGLASVVTAACFVVALFLTPLVTVIPSEAATPALVVVGFLMLAQLRYIEWDDPVLLLAAGLTVVLMPFTYSITNGVGAGVLAYVIGRLAQGRVKDVHWLLYPIAAMFAFYFALVPIKQVLGVN
jgi:AGZA family xanthine/uracil permease-like MFS transporter